MKKSLQAFFASVKTEFMIKIQERGWEKKRSQRPVLYLISDCFARCLVKTFDDNKKCNFEEGNSCYMWWKSNRATFQNDSQTLWWYWDGSVLL